MAPSRDRTVVVGGGIVGIATALALAERGHLPVVLEAEDGLAGHQTGHNSGVIHSGLYYKPGSLKAKNCVAGAVAMVEFCRENGIPYEICGKVVVATDPSELPGLDELMRRGAANGVPGMRKISVEELRELEPHCTGIAAFHVPGTGIVNYALVAQKYAELIQTAGGQILTNCAVIGIHQGTPETVIETTRGSIKARRAINCAGL